MRWFRFYDDAINDPKILKLSDRQHRIWVGLLCLASKNGGVLPSFDDIALMLRWKPEKLQPEFEALIVAGLFDHFETGVEPHNWKGRQFKSDVSNDRVKQHRQRKRNVTPTVTVTPPETEYRNREQKDSEANASGADAPVDHRQRLFSEGLQKLAAMTGKGPDACRSYVGKCLKEAGDDAVTVLGLIEDAHRNRVVDPSAWIAARLKSKGKPNGQRTVHDAANDLHARVLAFDEPAPGGLRDGEGEGAVRLLPAR